MKKLKFLSYLMAALVMFTTVSCDDDDDDDDDLNPNPTKTELLTASVWTGDKVYYGEQDVTDFVKNELDVTTTSIKFNTNGTYTATISGEPEESGTWMFMANETQIMLVDDNDDELLVNINQLTSTQLWAESKFIANSEEMFELRFKR